MTCVNMRIKLIDNVTRQPISDARVIFRYLCIDGECYNEHELVSNANGYVYFLALSGTRYDGRINAIGYEKRNFDFTAPAIATTITYNITPGTPTDVPTLHVFVKGDNAYLGYANVTIQGVVKNTDTSGSAKFDLPYGTYSIKATATGFESVTVVREFSAASMSVFLNMTPGAKHCTPGRVIRVLEYCADGITWKKREKCSQTGLTTYIETNYNCPGAPDTSVVSNDDDGFDWEQWLEDNKIVIGIIATVTAGLIIFYLTRGK